MKPPHGLTQAQFCIGFLFLLFIFASGKPLRAASAVATGLDSQGHLSWGWAACDSLETAKSRAMAFCRVARPKVVLSTPTRGYGAIVLYKTAGNSINVATAVGEKTEQQAIDTALKKAKSAGGYTPKLWRTWHDFAFGENRF